MQLEFWYVCPDDDGAVVRFFPVVYVVPRGKDASSERFPGLACGFMADLYLSVRIFSHPAPKRPKAALQIMLGLHHFVDFDMLYTDGDQLVDLRHKSQHLGPCIAPVFSCHDSSSRHNGSNERRDDGKPCHGGTYGIVIFEHLRFLP